MDAIKMVGPHEEQEEELNDLSLLQRASRFSSNASLCGDLETTSSYFQYEQELALVALAIAVVSCSLDIQKMTQLEMTAETTAKYVFVILPNHGMTQVLPRTTAHKKKDHKHREPCTLETQRPGIEERKTLRKVQGSYPQVN